MQRVSLKHSFCKKKQKQKKNTILTHCMGFKFGDLLGLAWPKVVHPDDVIRASCGQEHTTWTHTYTYSVSTIF